MTVTELALLTIAACQVVGVVMQLYRQLHTATITEIRTKDPEKWIREHSRTEPPR